MLVVSAVAHGTQPTACASPSPQPFRQDVAQRLATVLIEGDHAFTREMGIEHDHPALHAYQEVGETRRTPVQSTRRGYRFATVLVRAVGVIAVSNITNNGALSVTNNQVHSSMFIATATAAAHGMEQDLNSLAGATGSLVNTGTITVSSVAIAQASLALAKATATGETQVGAACGPVSLTATNSGTLDVNVHASALNGVVGTAKAHGVGYVQVGSSSTSTDLSLTNSGTVDVNVNSVADAKVALATGNALGFQQVGSSTGVVRRHGQ